jgi:hypothetical protein
MLTRLALPEKQKPDYPSLFPKPLFCSYGFVNFLANAPGFLLADNPQSALLIGFIWWWSEYGVEGVVRKMFFWDRIPT